MGFSAQIVYEVLVQCERICCLCGKDAKVICTFKEMIEEMILTLYIRCGSIYLEGRNYMVKKIGEMTNGEEINFCKPKR